MLPFSFLAFEFWRLSPHLWLCMRDLWIITFCTTRSDSLVAVSTGESVHFLLILPAMIWWDPVKADDERRYALILWTSLQSMNKIFPVPIHLIGLARALSRVQIKLEALPNKNGGQWENIPARPDSHVSRTYSRLCLASWMAMSQPTWSPWLVHFQNNHKALTDQIGEQRVNTPDYSDSSISRTSLRLCPRRLEGQITASDLS